MKNSIFSHKKMTKLTILTAFMNKMHLFLLKTNQLIGSCSIKNVQSQAQMIKIAVLKFKIALRKFNRKFLLKITLTVVRDYRNSNLNCSHHQHHQTFRALNLIVKIMNS